MSPSPERSNSNVNDEENGGPSLPEDLVFELLTRVPLDDLAACRVVSTRWRSITYERTFAPLHCRRAAAVSGYFIQSVQRITRRYRADFVSMRASPAAFKARISLDFLPSAKVRLEAVAAHRGLACCVEADTRRRPCYYVCKPATRQWRALPNPRVRFRTAATAMVARPTSGTASAAAAEFKIVRFSVVPALRDSLRCEVFDSRWFAWRRAADVPLCPESLPSAEPAMRAHGCMHWLRWPDRDTRLQDVFAFDLKSEAWRLIPLPREVDERNDPWARKKISAVEGRLCLLVTTDAAAGEEVLEVWEMASYAEGRWEKKMTASLKSLHAQEGNDVILRHLYSPDVAFLHGFCRVMWYDFSRGKMAEFRVNHVGVREVFRFESDLIPCELGKASNRPPRSTSKEAQKGDYKF